MGLILNIDTTYEVGSIAIAKNGEVLGESMHSEQRDHAGWLQEAIGSLAERISIKLSEVDAIAVTGGPGSYTGIRVGLASAKGLCYALNIPMIQINTLECMFHALRDKEDLKLAESTTLYCPMIDARREEVWMGIFHEKGQVLLNTGPQILTNFEFNKYLTGGELICYGSGADKYNYLLNMPKIKILPSFTYKASDMVNLSENLYHSKKFTDLIYSEPYYLKEFYTNSLKS